MKNLKNIKISNKAIPNNSYPLKVSNIGHLRNRVLVLRLMFFQLYYKIIGISACFNKKERKKEIKCIKNNQNEQKHAA